MKVRGLARYTEPTRGFGGWLIVFLFGVCVAALLRIAVVVQLGVVLIQALGHGAALLDVAPMLGAWVTEGGLLIGTLYGIRLFLLGDARTPTFWAAFLLASVPAMLAFLAFVAWQAAALQESSFGAALWSSLRDGGLRGMLASVIWALYWMRSLRVLLTYGNNGFSNRNSVVPIVPLRESDRVGPRALSGFRFAADKIRVAPSARPGEPPDETTFSLPLLTYLHTPDAAEWLRTSLTTFGKSVASFLPGHFAAYARIYHPFDSSGVDSPLAARTWRELAEIARVDLEDPAAAAKFAHRGVFSAQARTGDLPPALIERLLELLRPATTTPDACLFAVWEGFGGSAVPRTFAPTLELPGRAYHLFAGPLDGARTSYSSTSFIDRSANLWWPSDHAWCVATEVDFAWTYVGGSRACIDAVLADPSLDAVETTAVSRW